jgi:lipid-binding SYLF domain-containing protein
MLQNRRRFIALTALALLAAPSGRAAEASVIETRVDRALEELFATVDGARDVAALARGVLVMPSITKAGFVLGGTYGEGALRVGGETVGYYSVAAASLGLQVGIQTTKQALFFMTDEALAGFRRADGWTVGVNAEVTVPGQGVNKGVDTVSRSAPIVAYVFGQDGLLAGASVEGAKYSVIQR